MGELFLIQNMFSGSVLPEKQGKMKKKKLFQKSGIFPMDSPTTENDETFPIVRNKIDRHGLQQYLKDFKEYITDEHKGKASATYKLFEETLWYLRHATSNYRSRTGFQWKFKRIGVELNGVVVGKDRTRVGVGVEIQKIEVELEGVGVGVEIQTVGVKLKGVEVEIWSGVKWIWS